MGGHEPSGRVTVTGGFWGDRLRINREVTIPHALRQLEATGSLEAFRPGGGRRARGPFPGNPVYRDSDVAKWIEAASRSLREHPDRKLAADLEAVVNLVVGAQQPDGYLNTYFTSHAPDRRWSNLRDQHELYCAGHLFEAAVAHHEATGRRNLLEAACRYADYIGTVFGPGRGQRRGYPGHEEIELALLKLARATGRKRYTGLAKFFIDERGRRPCYFDIEARARGEDPGAGRHRGGSGEPWAYYQAHRPVREQDTAEGHAVRAGYLYAGMAALAAETADEELFAVCLRIWRNITERRLHVHGGVGSEPLGERFSVDYDLPDLDTYSETCASLALVFFAQRLLLARPDRGYADVIERALYNSILSCASLDGTRFFYANRLACIPGLLRFRNAEHRHHHPPDRQEWFGTACCPTNLCRFLPALGQYIYARAGNEVRVHQYINSRLEIELGGGPAVIGQQGEYPWRGRIRFTVETGNRLRFALRLRLPGWCRRARLRFDSGPWTVPRAGSDGYITLDRSWSGVEQFELDFEMPVERVEAHPAAWQNCGRVALQRGPVLFCLEEIDNGPHLHDLVLPPGSGIRTSFGAGELGSGVPVLAAAGFRRSPAAWAGCLYRPGRSRKVARTLRAIPYFLWNNRGTGEMAVWLREG